MTAVDRRDADRLECGTMSLFRVAGFGLTDETPTSRRANRWP
jgi:hypothetical protein